KKKKKKKENLGVFYEIECYQYMIIDDLRNEEFVDIRGCCLVGFSKSLPKSWIIRRPLWIDVVYQNGRRKFNVLELTEEEYAAKLQQQKQKEHDKEESLNDENAVVEIEKKKWREKGEEAENIFPSRSIFFFFLYVSACTHLLTVRFFFNRKPSSPKRVLQMVEIGVDHLLSLGNASKMEEKRVDSDEEDGEHDFRKNKDDDDDDDDDDNNNDDDDNEDELKLEQQQLNEAQIEYEKKVIEYKTRAYYLFEKYIRLSASHEINISGPSREEYTKLLDNREAWINNRKYHTKNKLLHVFDKVKVEIGRLLRFGFQQFRGSSRYGKFVSKVYENQNRNL
ncbi:hypothetical protein RFI_23559, partial [Reticulomyxa filosa]